MRRIILAIVALIMVGLIGYTFLWMYRRSKTPPTVFKTETAQKTSITKKTVATGSIVPRREVEVKPKVTGVLYELTVEAGTPVKIGMPLGKINIVPDAGALNRAQSEVRTAQISLDNAKRELDRNEALLKQGVIADAEVARYRTDYALRRQEVAAAGSNLQIVKEGQTAGQGKNSNVVVTATSDGTVIDVPVKVGFSVIAANNFNPGTTVATIADMNDMIFQGRVDESEVAKVKEHMKLAIKVGALDKDIFDGTLEYIAPKGKEIDGSIQFEIKAALTVKPGVYIRAGYSANADIILDEKKDVVAIREALVQYQDGKPYIEIEGAPQVFERRSIEVGISDGIMVEVKTPLGLTDKIKVPQNAGDAEAPNKGPGSGGKGGKSRGK
jgi:HlyD family secretion protein